MAVLINLLDLDVVWVPYYRGVVLYVLLIVRRVLLHRCFVLLPFFDWIQHLMDLATVNDFHFVLARVASTFKVFDSLPHIYNIFHELLIYNRVFWSLGWPKHRAAGPPNLRHVLYRVLFRTKLGRVLKNIVNEATVYLLWITSCCIIDLTLLQFNQLRCLLQFEQLKLRIYLRKMFLVWGRHRVSGLIFWRHGISMLVVCVNVYERTTPLFDSVIDEGTTLRFMKLGRVAVNAGTWSLPSWILKCLFRIDFKAWIWKFMAFNL